MDQTPTKYLLLPILLCLFSTTRFQPAQAQNKQPQNPKIDLDTCNLQVYEKFLATADDGVSSNKQLMADNKEKCVKKIKSLLLVNHGPPTQWDMFEASCKGDCSTWDVRVRKGLDESKM